MEKTKKNLKKYHQVYQLRLQGKTFEYIGKKFKFTRQRAQKIFIEYAKIKSKLKIDIYDNKKCLDIVCEYCIKKIDNKDKKIECEDNKILIYYHIKCWKKVVFK